MGEDQLEALKRLLAGAPAALYRLEWREGEVVPEVFQGFGLPEGGAFVPVFVSERVRDMLGYEPAECLSMDWWLDRVCSDDLAKVLNDFRRLMAQGKVDTSYRFRAADGRMVWIENRARVLTDEHGHPRGIVGWWLDVSRSHEHQQFFRQAARLLPDGLIAHQDGRVLFANKAAERIFDDAGNWLGLDIRQRIHPDYRAVVLQRAQALLAGEYPVNPPMEERLLRRDGSPFWAEVSSTCIEFGGKKAVLAVIRDITERKRVEARLREFRSLLDQTVDAVFLIEAESARFLDANDAALTRLGYERRDLLQRRVMDISEHVKDETAWREMVARLRAHGDRPPPPMEGVHIRRDGTRFPVEVTARYV